MTIIKLLIKFAEHNFFRRLGAAFVVLLLISCGDSPIEIPPSLDGPRAMTVASGDVCLDSYQSPPGIYRPRTEDCDPDSNPGIGLVVNQRSDRLAVVDMGRKTPRILDMEANVPGVNHIKVGNNPVDVAVSSDGTAAYVLNQADSTISIVNLWSMGVVRTKSLPETPDEILGVDRRNQFAVTLSSPSRVVFFSDITCQSEPNNPSQEPCAIDDPEFEQIERQLAGNATDIALGPRQQRLYAVYRNKPFVSVLQFEGSEAVSCLNSGRSFPCEVERYGLTYGCMDHIDNDGDGSVDSQDIQCFKPNGAESRDGIGRAPEGKCNNGIDDDSDGHMDRQDSACQIGADPSESNKVFDFDEPPQCRDEKDNDSDGAVDYPEDSSCYGDVGERETAPSNYGGESVDVGPMGQFLYVADRAENQLLVIDLQHGELIDAQRAVSDSREAFSSNIGIPLTGAPSSLEGGFTRTFRRRGRSRALVQYNYSATVATDVGGTERVDIMSTICGVKEADKILEREAVSITNEAYRESNEFNCLETPNFPVKPDESASSCQAVRDCEECLEEGRGDCAVCNGIDVARDECQRSGRIGERNGVKYVWNPEFEVGNLSETPPALAGAAQCQTPPEFEERTRQYFRENPEGPQFDRCTLPLRPQPISMNTTEQDLAEGGRIQRATFRRNQQLTLERTDSSAFSSRAFGQIDDQLVQNETWNVVYEGILPGTRRNDGLVAAESASGFDPGAIQLCEAGVRAGDTLTIRTSPREIQEPMPEGCDTFVGEEEASRFRTWRIESVEPTHLELSVIEEEGDTNRFADQLPSRECFSKGVAYEIRTEGEWLVKGENTGVISTRKSLRGECVPVFKADHPNRRSRVETGSVFEGPYFRFRLFEGQIQPETGLSYEFRTISNYRPSITSFLSSRRRSNSTLPGELNRFETGERTYLAVPDLANDFIYLRWTNRRGGTESVFVR